MQAPSQSSSTPDLVVAGLFHLEALPFFDRADLAEAFRPLNDALAAAYDRLLAAERAEVVTRANLQHLDVEVDALVMAFAEAVKHHDGERGSAHFARIFPRDVDAVVDPVGALQATALARIVEALEGEALAPLAGTWRDPLAERAAAYERAVEAHDARRAELRAARDEEVARREAWFTQVASHLEALTAVLPDTDLTQRLVFPQR